MSPATQKEISNSAITRAVTELRYTIVATGLVLLLGLSFYLFLPSLGEIASTETKSLAYKRIYSYPAWGARIEYQALTAKLQAKSKARLQQDLEILARRFGRGNFNIISLPGIKSSLEYQGVARYYPLYDYKVQGRDGGAVLEIRMLSQRAQAVQALHEYLRYLEKNWRS